MVDAGEDPLAAEEFQHLENPRAFGAADNGDARGMNEDTGFHAARHGEGSNRGLERRSGERLW